MMIACTSRFLYCIRRNKFRMKLFDDRFSAIHPQNNGLIINLRLEILERKLPVIPTTART